MTGRLGEVDPSVKGAWSCRGVAGRGRTGSRPPLARLAGRRRRRSGSGRWPACPATGGRGARLDPAGCPSVDGAQSQCVPGSTWPAAGRVGARCWSPPTIRCGSTSGYRPAIPCGGRRRSRLRLAGGGPGRPRSHDVGVSSRGVRPTEQDRGVHPWATSVCFGGVGTGEVVTADGRKVVGLAQRRNRAGAWFHGACVRQLGSGRLGRRCWTVGAGTGWPSVDGLAPLPPSGRTSSVRGVTDVIGDVRSTAVVLVARAALSRFSPGSPSPPDAWPAPDADPRRVVRLVRRHRGQLASASRPFGRPASGHAEARLLAD